MKEIDLVKIAAEQLFDAGWEIEVNTSRHAIQLDILATKEGADPLLVECKAFQKKVGVRTAQEYIGVVRFLRQSQPGLDAWMVTTSGFTEKAYRALMAAGVIPMSLPDFKMHLPPVERQAETFNFDSKITKDRKSVAFVIMPFSDDMLDVFLLGIRHVAEELDFVARRADDLEHNGEIINEIKEAIREADFVIADTTGANPNVCYEVGFSHALEKQTVLICKRGENLPFDLKGTNHLMYPNVNSLRDTLKAKIQSMPTKFT